MSKSPFNRGGKKHYAELAKKSVDSRIKRHIECAVVLDGDAKIPVRVRNTDAGYDIVALSGATIYPGQLVKFETGLHVRCPEGYFYRTEDRSSLLRRGLVIRQGVLDATYTGPISVWMLNQNPDRHPTSHGEIIEKGDRIAQLMFYPQIHVKFIAKSQFTPEEMAGRGDSGYGSTGK